MSQRTNAEMERWKDEWLDRNGHERVLQARWLLNPDAEPLSNVQLTEQHGVVVDIRPISDSDTQDVLPIVLIPPLVNAHTHLEFSSLTQPLQPPQPFQDWIQAVMNWRRRESHSVADAVRSGLQESWQAGVRLIGEITTGEHDMQTGLHGITVVSYRESIGLRPERIQAQLQETEKHLVANRQPGVIFGVSPHAPYTVHPDLLQELMTLAMKYQAPVAMHLAETTDELELLSCGRGPFADFLNSLGLFDPQTFPGDRSVLELLKELARAPKALAIHGNYFQDQDIAFLARHPNITTVYCPRTHSYFGHSAHPFRKMLSAGVRVILGTDSRASNPDLCLWHELQHAARLAPELPASQLLAMITTHAAEAMGIDSKDFRIRQGGTFPAALLSFDEPLSAIEDIVRHKATILQGP